MLIIYINSETNVRKRRLQRRSNYIIIVNYSFNANIQNIMQSKFLIFILIIVIIKVEAMLTQALDNNNNNLNNSVNLSHVEGDV